MMYVTRKEHFSASHRLHNPDINNDENIKLFGKCNNFHGHNYYLEVTVSGEINPETGYVIDLKILKNIILTEIIEKVDHQLLNDVEIFSDINPTTENIAKVFWKILENKLRFPEAKLFSIKLFETDKNFVELRND